MVTFSEYPDDPRPRRAVDALLKEGISVDLICQGDGTKERSKEGELTVTRIPIRNRRGGKIAYVCQYLAFIVISATILAARSLKRRYDVVHVHNMPDVLVVASLVPKALGARVILDLHDPMPELMTTIYDLPAHSFGVRFIKYLEKWSIARADVVVTVNAACKRIFAARSCRPEKINVVMNSPDEQIFPLRQPGAYAGTNNSTTGRFAIMYHGSLVERNGLDLAVDALAKVRQVIPGAELRIFGRKTPFLERVMSDVRDRGLEECVHYLGPRRLEDLVLEIDNCDVGVISNHRNAFTDINTPTRLFEYLALGKPVIAPRTLGIQDYFDTGSLFFFEPGNAGELARQLLFVANHPNNTVNVARRGQEVYLRHRWYEERQIFVNVVRDLLQQNADC